VVADPCLDNEVELVDLLVSHLHVKAGFTLTDPNDLRYQTVAKSRARFGNVIQRAASVLRKNTGGEDHVDAVLGIAKAIDIYLLEYGFSRGNFESLQKNYAQAKRLIFPSTNFHLC
jgi:proteasome activator subunit 4